MSRPAGSGGCVRQALDAAATTPGTVRQLAQRSQVGYALAKCTVSRMIDAGELLVLDDGRPALVISARRVVVDQEPAIA
jgi:hypothetical protein